MTSFDTHNIEESILKEFQPFKSKVKSVKGGYFMSLIHYVGIMIVLVIISMVFLIRKANKNDTDKKPKLSSLLALGIIVINWFIYLLGLFGTDSYIIIPGKIGDFIFIPLWFVVSILGLVAASKEYKNNKKFSILVSGLAIINFIVGMLLWGISKM